jgi:hypothetical protein
MHACHKELTAYLENNYDKIILDSPIVNGVAIWEVINYP